jgi:hypothetical protein
MNSIIWRIYVFVSRTEGGTYLKGIREWDAEEDFLGGCKGSKSAETDTAA